MVPMKPLTLRHCTPVPGLALIYQLFQVSYIRKTVQKVGPCSAEVEGLSSRFGRP